MGKPTKATNPREQLILEHKKFKAKMEKKEKERKLNIKSLRELDDGNNMKLL